MSFYFGIESRVIKKFYGNMSRILQIMFQDLVATLSQYFIPLKKYKKYFFGVFEGSHSSSEEKEHVLVFKAF
jgi:hypothetical protein